MIKSNGLLFLTISLSKDSKSFIDYNTHRLYDLESLDLTLKNWIVIDKEIYNFGSDVIFVLKKRIHSATGSIF